MNVDLLILNLNSEKPRELFEFYRDVVGLPRHTDPDRENTLMAGGAELVFDSHSQVVGRAPQPARMLVNFFVTDLSIEEARIKSAGVKCLRSQGREFWGGVISTFEDPDGNYFQLIEYRPEA